MPNKLTDAEVKKALECCIKASHFGDCFENQCPLVSEKGCKVGKETLYPYVLDLINRQNFKIHQLEKQVSEIQNANLIDFKGTIANYNAENESLKAEIERLNALVKTKNKLIEGLDQSISYAYDRAIKDFAERLKNEIINDTAYACDSTQHSGYYDYQIKIGDIPEYIDNLLNELVGGSDGENN